MNKSQNIIKMGGSYKIFGEGIQGVDSLPASTLTVRFSEMSGYSLETITPITVTKKVYGNHIAKAEKVLTSFQNTTSNLGVMYGGKKGTGKSISSQIIAEKANKMGLPVIIVNYATPGLKDFLNQIEQEAVVVFDEFEKSFKKEEQDDLLNLFDGLSSHKKLFVITYNEERLLTPYVNNRPGRFRYKFNFDNLSNEIIEEYLTDNVENCPPKVIKTIQFLNDRVTMTFDYLNAICAELNQGYSLSETLEDLNINFLSDRVSYTGNLKINNVNKQFNFTSGLSDKYVFEIPANAVSNNKDLKGKLYYSNITISVPTVNMNLEYDTFTVKSTAGIELAFKLDDCDDVTAEDELQIAEDMKLIDLSSITFRENRTVVNSINLDKLTI